MDCLDTPAFIQTHNITQYVVSICKNYAQHLNWCTVVVYGNWAYMINSALHF